MADQGQGITAGKVALTLPRLQQTLSLSCSGQWLPEDRCRLARLCMGGALMLGVTQGQGLSTSKENTGAGSPCRTACGAALVPL